MRFLLNICFVATVAAIGPTLAQDAMEGEASIPAIEAAAPLSEVPTPPGRVGNLSLRSGNVGLRVGPDRLTDAEVNQPVFTGERSGPTHDPRRDPIGGNTIDLSNGTEIEIASLTDQLPKSPFATTRSSSAPDRYGETVDRCSARRHLAAGFGRLRYRRGRAISRRGSVFDGAAHLSGPAGPRGIKAGQMAVLTGSDDASATIEPAAPDEFVEWSRGRDYDETRLAAPYYVSPYMAGFAELDAAGLWKISAEYGPVWFPTGSEEWTPYRFGHWSWMAPWGWT
jgi:hypothetical protein